MCKAKAFSNLSGKSNCQLAKIRIKLHGANNITGASRNTTTFG